VPIAREHLHRASVDVTLFIDGFSENINRKMIMPDYDMRSDENFLFERSEFEIFWSFCFVF